MDEYEVAVYNTFQAESAEDAVMQMVEYLLENAGVTAYRVRRSDSYNVMLIDAEDCGG